MSVSMPPPAAATPPGLPAVGQTTLDQLLQMITVQMQQQHAQQARVQDMLRHMANAQNTGRPGVRSGGTVTSYKAMGERHFRCIKVFENKSDTWKEWRTHFLTAVRESSPIIAGVQEKAESSDTPVVDEDVLKTSQTYQEALDLEYILYACLVSTTKSVSFRDGGVCGREWDRGMEVASTEV